MAGNGNSGRIPTFSIGEKELERRIEQYKADVKDGVIVRASWPHFCASLDCTEKDVADVMAMEDNPGSAYKIRARMLKKMLTWCRGQMLSAPGWNGQMTARAIFALKQDMGDGVKYTDKDDGKTGPVEIKVSFGGDDPRAKQASK